MKGKPIPVQALLAAALLLAGLGAILVLARSTLARSSAGYDLSWYSVDGGGGMGSQGGGVLRSPDGSISLDGAAGQPDAGLLGAEDVSLAGGFLPGGELFAQQRFIYLPLALRSH